MTIKTGIAAVYVNCMETQCTEEPDAGPLGTTCGQVSPDGVQLCS